MLNDVEHNCLVNSKNDIYCKVRKKHKRLNNHKPYDLNPQLNKGNFFMCFCTKIKEYKY